MSTNTVCNDYLGMENGDIPDVNITASSEFILPKNSTDGDGNGYAREARLNGKSCWRAHLSSTEKPWIQANIGYQTYVSGVVTQGDGGVGGKNNRDWVKTLKVSAFSISINDTEVFVKNDSGEVKVRTLVDRRKILIRNKLPFQ